MKHPYLYEVVPISVPEADKLREVGGETYVADEHPGYPCRQCLKDARVGDELILVSHDPFPATSKSPYRSSSPIFLHKRQCESPIATDDLPEQLTRRQLSVRAFDSDEMMIDADIIDGSNLETTITRLFCNESTDHIHIHNAVRGCWAAKTVRR